MTSRTGSARRILAILKKVSRVETCLGRRRLAFACSPKPGQWPLWRMPNVLGAGGRWKSQNRKNVYLSPYVEEPLNAKVIKSFVPELRSRYVFFEFRDSYVLSLWTFDVRFTHSHIMAMVQEEASTLQIGSVAFPPGQCTSPQLHPCHRLFDQDGHHL